MKPAKAQTIPMPVAPVAPPPASCCNCRFWYRNPSAEIHPDQGKCRRYPEELSKAAASWCGEWRSREPPKDAQKTA